MALWLQKGCALLLPDPFTATTLIVPADDPATKVMLFVVEVPDHPAGMLQM
ncbi:MAG: hypothetical protein IPP34_15315 [Bacteroidetes bacterium]|nr:hypothetical protein [Bacteroidota bacterium]